LQAELNDFNHDKIIFPFFEDKEGFFKKVSSSRFKNYDTQYL